MNRLALRKMLITVVGSTLLQISSDQKPVWGFPLTISPQQYVSFFISAIVISLCLYPARCVFCV